MSTNPKRPENPAKQRDDAPRRDLTPQQAAAWEAAMKVFQERRAVFEALAKL